MALDWSKEESDSNLCGYCGGPTYCDGSCFTRTDWMEEKVSGFKLIHLKKELAKLPEQKAKLEQREKDLKEELQKLEAKNS